MNDDEISANILRALSNVTDDGENQIQMVIKSGIVPYCVSMLGNSNIQVKMAALRLIGNIATGNADQTQVLLDCDVLRYMPDLLAHPKERIKRVSNY
jgi:hypothetical protein